jgi:hypothetical protein
MREKSSNYYSTWLPSPLPQNHKLSPNKTKKKNWNDLGVYRLKLAFPFPPASNEYISLEFTFNI